MTKIKDFIQGDARVIQINCFQSDGVTPLNLNGCKLYFTVNANSAPADDTSALFQKTYTTFIAPSGAQLPTGITAGQNTATLGIAWVTIATGDTQSATPATYYYNYRVIDGSGNPTSQKEDEFTIIPSTTRTNT